MSNDAAHGSRQDGSALQVAGWRLEAGFPPPVATGMDGKHLMHGDDTSPCRATMLDAYRDLIDRGASSRTATIAALDVYRAYHPKGKAHENLNAVKEILGPLWAW